MFEPDENWSEATPQNIPPPTYWPVTLALGITFIFWGFVTTYIIYTVGFIIFTIGLAGWIIELRKAVISNNENESTHET